MTSTAAAGDGGEAAWEPAFPGQRPPFKAGHTASTHTGYMSERRIEPLATQIAGALLADPDTPEHLREPIFTAAVQAWARAEATCQLLQAWLAERDITAALTDLETEKSDEEHTAGGKGSRKTVTRRLPSVLETARKYETLAAKLRSQLGIDPMSAARLGRDLAARRYMDAAPLNAALDQIAKRRQELESGSAGE